MTVIAPPDVTVVVPVYNTMPYLTACLESLVAQTLGEGRLEVIAVDDGSDDGSAEELDRYAAAHPGLFTVVHQANSGGPAQPCNRGLELASGRFVFFLGADDYLWEGALERLVERADAWGSDIIFGRMVGVGGRAVDQQLFTADDPDVPFPHSRLPYALANTKLFRRSLLEQHGVRYPLDLRLGSDQPFTIEAMLAAGRISVLADRPYYYAVRRDEATNISYSVDWRVRLADIGAVMDHVAAVVPPGETRDAILVRHFTWEIGKRLRRDVSDLAEDEQHELCGVVAALADRYLTDGLSSLLGVSARLRVRFAQTGDVEALRELNDFSDSDVAPLLVLEGPRVFLAFPGFRVEGHPDAWFEAHVENVRRRMRSALTMRTEGWQGSRLLLRGASELHPASAGNVHAVLARRKGTPPRFRAVRKGRRVAVRAGVSLQGRPDGSSAESALDLTSMVADAATGQRRRWVVRVRARAGTTLYDYPVAPGDAVAAPSRVVVRSGARFVELRADTDHKGRVVVDASPVPATEVALSALRIRRERK